MKKKLIRLTEADLHNVIKESVRKILRESNELYDEWYEEEDYDGNTGEPGMIRSYEVGAIYDSNAEAEAKEAGYSSMKDYLEDWFLEVKPELPWYWTKVGNGYGYNGDTVFVHDGVVCKNIYGQIMFDEYPIGDARRNQDFQRRLNKGEYWIK